MNSIKKKPKATKYITFLYDNQLPSFTQFSLLCFQSSHFSHYIEGALLLLEFIQLTAQSLLLNPASYDNNANEPDPDYIQSLMYFAKLFLPGYWITFEDDSSPALIVLFIVFVVMMLKYLLFGYVLAIAYWGIRSHKLLLRIWGIIFKLQGRILCVFFTSFWANAIIACSKEGVNFSAVGNTAIISLGLILMILEYTFSFFLQIKVCYSLPTKSFLSAKSNKVESLTLFQKVFLQILQMVLFKASWAVNTWTFVTINLVLSFFRDAEFYASLPLYNLHALKFQSILVMIVNSLNISSFFQALVETLGDDEPDMSFIIIVWVIVGILAVKLSTNSLNRMMERMAMSQFIQGSPMLRIHKVIVTKDLRKEWDGTNPAKGTNQEAYLVSKSVNVHASSALSLSPQFIKENEVDINSKESVHKMLLNYIEKLALKNPKNSFIKLYLAYFYAKKLNYFGLAIRLITELHQGASSRARLSASLLIYEIQNSIRKQYEQNDDKIDMLAYISSQAQLSTIKDAMLEQAELQIDFYKETISETPDLAKVYNISQEVKIHQSRVNKKMREFLANSPEAFFEPIMLFSQYSIRLNHSLSDYLGYLKTYSRKYEKFGRYLKEYNLIPENLYQEGTVFLTLSGRRGEAGKILYCTKSASQLFGGDPNLYVGTLISTMAAPSLSEFVAESWKKAAEKGDYASVHFSNVMQFYNKDGYLTLAHGHISIHPFMTHGFYMNMVLRPIISPHVEHILIRENGDIECATKKIAERLGVIIPRSSAVVRSPNIGSLSPDLKKANQAFNLMNGVNKAGNPTKSERNMFASEDDTSQNGRRTPKGLTMGQGILNFMAKQQQSKDTMREAEAEELHSLYSTSGQNIWLSSLNNGKGSASMDQVFEYNCKIAPLLFGPNGLKMISLQETMNKGTAGTQLTDLENEKANSQLQQQQQQSLKETQVFEDDGNDSGFFKSENEKQNGWIDLHMLSSPERYVQTTTQPMYLTTAGGGDPLATNDGYLLSPLSSPSSVPLKFSVRSNLEEKPRSPLLSFSKQHTSNSHSMKNVDAPSPSMRRQNKRRVTEIKELIAEGSVHDSNWSKTSQKKKISNAYKSALNLKYYSKKFTTFLISFYLILFGVFVAQLVLHLKVDSTVKNILGKKDVLSNAQTTNFYLIQTTGILRALQNLENNKFTAAELGSIFAPPFVYIDLALGWVGDLINSNQNLMNSIDTTSSDIRDDYFESDIRIYDYYFDSADQTYTVLNSFASTNRVAEKAMEALALQNTDIPQSLEMFEQIYRNSLNDLLIKNQKIASELSESVSREEEQIDVVTTQDLILTIAIIVVFTMLISFAIWKQYTQQKANLTSIIRLKTVRLKDAIISTQEFMKVVNSDELFIKDDSEMGHGESTRRGKGKSDNSNGKVGITRENSKVPVSKGILMTSLMYFGKIIIFVSVLIGIIVWSAILVKNSTKFFHTKQEQIYFAEYLRVRSYICQIAAQELFSAPPDALIENTKIEPWTASAIEGLKNLRITASTIFQGDDSNYDAALEEILFKDGCSLVYSSQAMFCDLLYKKGMNTGLIYLLTSFEGIMNSRLERYQNSDKSAQDLRDIEAMDVELLVAVSLVIVEQCLYIRKFLNDEIDSNLQQSDSHKNTAIVISSLAVFILGFVFWIFIFKVMRESYNKFKNVLRIIPSDLVLSSFILKNFLIKTSNGALDFIKNNI